jgi:hypothetical protein
MVNAKILEKQKKMLEVCGPARIKGIITVTIKKYCGGLPWLNQNCYTYYVRQLKGAPEEIITTRTSDGESINNISGLTSSKNDNGNPLFDVNLNVSDAVPMLPSWIVTPNNNADKGSAELSDKDKTASYVSTAMDINTYNATY